MRKTDNSDVKSPGLWCVCLLSQRNRVFFLDMDVFVKWQHAYDWRPCQLFQLPPAFFKKPAITAELIDQHSADKGLLFRGQQRQRAINAAKTPPLSMSAIR